MNENKWIVNDDEEATAERIAAMTEQDRLELLGNLILDRILEDDPGPEENTEPYEQ